MRKAMELAAAMAEKPRHSLELLKKCMSIERRQMLEASCTLEAFMHHISFNQHEIESRILDNFAS
jgi:polyketide biosynthesis enoyl-CoA hydratase PksI